MGRVVASCRGAARRLGLVVAAVVLVTALPTAAHASSSSGFVADINAARTSRGGHALTAKGDLTAAAQAQAERMADKSELYHNPDLGGSVSNWTMLAENVGYGPDVATIHAAFMASPGHRANILNAKYTEVGVGVVVRNHVMWVAEVFRRPAGASSGSGSGSSGSGSGSSGSTKKKAATKTSSGSSSHTADAIKQVSKPKAKPHYTTVAASVVVVPIAARRADLSSLRAEPASPAVAPSSASGSAAAGRGASGGTGDDPPGVPAPAAVTLSLLALVVLGCAARLRLT